MAVKGEISEVRQVQDIPEPQVVVTDYKQQRRLVLAAGRNISVYFHKE
ncbi:MAG: hypothetical protein IPO37_11985 [Saprospiraceae bacterium]|nr:hypothetical protein [Saprospiraceae bacterium]